MQSKSKLISNSINTEIGTIIKKYRAKKGYSQLSLGLKLCMDNSTISRYERGEHNFSAEDLKLFHNVFGDEFFDDVMKLL